MDNPKRKLVYFIRAINGGPVKIGSACDVEKRLAQLQTAYPYKLEILGTIPAAAGLERKLHKRFVGVQLNGEWFRWTDEIRQYISEHCLRSKILNEQVVFVSAKLKDANRIRVKAKIENNECLICDKAAWKRGVCSACHSRYRKELSRLSDGLDRANYEALHIAEGNILAGRQGQRAINGTNPFRDSVSK